MFRLPIFPSTFAPISTDFVWDVVVQASGGDRYFHSIPESMSNVMTPLLPRVSSSGSLKEKDVMRRKRSSENLTGDPMYVCLDACALFCWQLHEFMHMHLHNVQVFACCLETHCTVL